MEGSESISPSSVEAAHTVTARFVPVSGLYNTRYLSRYPTRSGKILRHGLLIRSGTLSALPEQQQDDLLCQLGIKTLIDMRTEPEVARSGPVRTGNAVRFHLPLPDVSQDPELLKLDLPHAYIEILSSYRNRIGEIISLVIDPINWPLLFHCTAGKDRTGIVAILTLALAEVDRIEIAKDYQLSELALARFLVDLAKGLTPVAFDPRSYPARVLRASTGTALQVLEFLNENYGSPESYLYSCGVSSQAIDRFRLSILE